MSIAVHIYNMFYIMCIYIVGANSVINLTYYDWVPTDIYILEYYNHFTIQIYYWKD